MPTHSEVKAALAEHVKAGIELLRKLVEAKKDSGLNFSFDYQKWYSKALPVVRSLAPDRYEEFRRYYEPDPKRKSLGYGTYVIQDYIKSVAPSKFHYPDFNTREQAGQGFLNQISILSSIAERLDHVLSDVEGRLFAGLKDAELATSQSLMKISVRAAGALAGVVLEAHLQRVADAHQVKIAKKAPTISDLNEPLKQADVYDVATWRKVGYLADIRNLCSHKKTGDPTAEQVQELIDGVNWAIKSIS